MAKISNPQTQQLVDDLEDAIRDCFEFSNESMDAMGWPEEYRDHRSGGRSLNEIDEVFNRRQAEKDELSAFQRGKLDKESRIEAYAWAYENDEPIIYDEDEDKLYRNQLTFCKLANMEFDDE